MLLSTIRPTRGQRDIRANPYSSGGVVESLYGATQEIVDKAHKGAGMSQTGAYAYAKQGYDYQQILGVYYPGVAIARLESKR